MGTRPILQVLFQVFFPVPVQVQCERFLLKPYNPFSPVPVPVPVLVLDQASVNTPLGVVTETETHMVSKRAVCILLECFLILIKNVKSDRICVPKSVKVQQLGVSP